MPNHATRVIATPRRCAIRAAHTGCVATRAVEDATVVNRRLGIHVAKCAPSSSPDSAMRRHCAPVSARTSARWRATTSTAVSPEPSAVRQNAIASAGAAHAAINGPEVEIATTATASSARSVPGGRDRVAGAEVGVLTRRTLRPAPSPLVCTEPTIESSIPYTPIGTRVGREGGVDSRWAFRALHRILCGWDLA